MNKPTDKELYDRIREGDREALEMLYDRYERLLYSFSFRMTNDSQASEEVMQDVFLKLWKDKGSGQYREEKGKFSSWLLTVTRNVSIDRNRKHKTQEVEWEERDSRHEEMPGVEQEIESKEERDELQSAIYTLPDAQQRMICLFYFQGYSQQEISNACDIPLGTVKGRIRLALQKLKENLAEERGIDLGK